MYFSHWLCLFVCVALGMSFECFVDLCSDEETENTELTTCKETRLVQEKARSNDNLKFGSSKGVIPSSSWLMDQESLSGNEFHDLPTLLNSIPFCRQFWKAGDYTTRSNSVPVSQSAYYLASKTSYLSAMYPISFGGCLWHLVYSWCCRWQEPLTHPSQISPLKCYFTEVGFWWCVPLWFLNCHLKWLLSLANDITWIFHVSAIAELLDNAVDEVSSPSLPFNPIFKSCCLFFPILPLFYMK